MQHAEILHLLEDLCLFFPTLFTCTQKQYILEMMPGSFQWNWKCPVPKERELEFLG